MDRLAEWKDVRHGLGTGHTTGIIGIVGLAGIGGTLLSARMTGSSEDRRAKLAEKRRVYAGFLAALTQYAGADDRMRAARS